MRKHPTGTCADCAGHGPIQARKLCPPCYKRRWKAGTIDQRPTKTHTEPDLVYDLDPVVRQLAQRRRDLSVSKTLVARAMGYTNATAITLLETGRRHPGIDLLRRWADVLGCDLAAIPLDSDGELEHDPTPVRLLTHEQRRAMMRKLATRNMSARAVAQRVGVSTRTVHRHRAAAGGPR